MIKFPKKTCDHCEHHGHSMWDELLCHVPYTIFSLALSFAVLGFFTFMTLILRVHGSVPVYQGYHILFHIFHYLHIIVAIAGAMITFFRFSQRVVTGFLVAVLAPTFFCIVSDILLPSIAGLLLGVNMHMHICFYDPHDAGNLIAFMVAGVAAGAALIQHGGDSLKIFALRSHFLHIFVSCLAALFYIVAHGLNAWYNVMGILFVFLFVAVIVPCTLSDVVVPLYCARHIKK